MEMSEIAVLVVDDVGAVRIQISDLLQSLGFKKIDLAANGEEAKRSMLINAYQLILCDWHMAPCDGLELIKYLRAQVDALKDSAFIMVTAEMTKDRVIQAIQSGVDDFLLKPLTGATVQSKILGALKKRKVL